jgi:low affinity Fe/Cu permease
MGGVIVVVLETGIFSHETSAMKERLRRFVQQAAAVVGSPRRGMVWSLIVFWVGTGLLFPFSRPWLWAVTTVTALGILFIVCRVLHMRNRSTRALSLKLDHLERALQQREKQLKRTMKTMHRGRHNGMTPDEK